MSSDLRPDPSLPLPSSRSGNDRAGEFLALALAFLVPLVAFLPTLRFGFVYDDRPLVLENRAIQEPGQAGRFFRQDIESLALGGDRVTSNYYRPMFLLAAAGLWRLFGPNPVGWHLAVVVLHALVSALAFLLLRDLGVRKWGALAGALLFALHPVHVDSAAWVSGLQDVLAGFLALSAWLLWRGWGREGGGARLAAFLVVAAGAFLSKESTFGLVILLAAEALVPAGFRPAGEVVSPEGARAQGRRRWIALAGIAVVAATILAVRFQVLGGFARRHPLASDDLLLAASLPRVLLEYLRLALLPVGIGFFSPVRPVTAILSAAVLVPLAVLLLLGSGVVAGLRRRPGSSPRSPGSPPGSPRTWR